MPAIYPVLNWSNARVIALLINALFGLQEHYESRLPSLDLDDIFALRIIQGYAEYVYGRSLEKRSDFQLSNQFRFLHSRANKTASKALSALAERKLEGFKKYKSLLSHSYKLFYNPRTASDHLWSTSESNASIGEELEVGIFSEPCFAEVLSNDDGRCNMNEKCLDKILNPSVTDDRLLSRQLFYAAVLLQSRCGDTLRHYFASANETLDNFVAARCFRLSQKLSLGSSSKEDYRRSFLRAILTMEKVFACGQFGFADGSSLYMVMSFVRLQHPKRGCFLESSFIEFENKNSSINSNEPDICSSHWSFAGALAVSLLFALSRSPYGGTEMLNQFGESDNLIRFKGFPLYDSDPILNSNFAQMRLVAPPYLGRPPSLFAFMSFILLIIVISLTVHQWCVRRPKRLYYFAYKNL